MANMAKGVVLSYSTTLQVLTNATEHTEIVFLCRSKIVVGSDNLSSPNQLYVRRRNRTCGFHSHSSILYAIPLLGRWYGRFNNTWFKIAYANHRGVLILSKVIVTENEMRTYQ